MVPTPSNVKLDLPELGLTLDAPAGAPSRIATCQRRAVNMLKSHASSAHSALRKIWCFFKSAIRMEFEELAKRAAPLG